jgi:hypothetical protein
MSLNQVDMACERWPVEKMFKDYSDVIKIVITFAA